MRDSQSHESTCQTPSDASFPASGRTSRSDITLTEENLLGSRIPAAATKKMNATSCCFGLRLPTLSRFLADFTLGFADGLTVPFALTAGLSSLGKTQTVIYAGMAEICAGSISMGIGGYLAAKGEQATDTAASGSDGRDAVDDEMGGDEEKEAALGSTDDVVEEYLAPLNLRDDLRAAVEAHVRSQPDLVDALRTKAQDDDDAGTGYGDRASSPVMVGLSVSVGYLLGGLLPLFPYFFVSQVSDGLRWSFGVCILALFLFGFTKHYLLQDDAQRHNRHQRRSAQWKRVRASLWEGMQMVVLGSIAAVTAVLAVKALEGLASRD
ncbi:kinase activator protein [Apiospora saccharicola]|uniref:Kinase activator protein n=1 Tax=Apiospora saccharicola TaxID=335842 RepID=A0ABR1WE60_9PEZI